MRYELGIIGCGNLGKHLLKLIKMNSAKISKIHVTTKSNLEENRDVGIKCDLIFLTAKPNQIKDICQEIKPFISGKLVISAAAGISFSHLQSWLYPTQPLIRIMPNIPISHKAGIIPYIKNKYVNSYQYNRFLETINGVKTYEFDKEENIDMSTALSGCGPAFMANIIQYYIEAGMGIGLTANQSKELVVSSMVGTCKMLETIDPFEIIEQVASKGGATEKGLIEMSKSDIPSAIRKIVSTSYDRVLEIKNNY
jgi:pyrroline-5-carboxylate reductase